MRTRKCNDPIPAHSGKPCPGDDRQQKACIIRRCSAGEYIFPHMLLGDFKMDGELVDPFFPDVILMHLNNSRQRIWILLLKRSRI